MRASVLIKEWFVLTDVFGYLGRVVVEIPLYATLA